MSVCSDRGEESPSVADVLLVDDVVWSEVKHLSVAAATGSRTQGLNQKCSSDATRGSMKRAEDRTNVSVFLEGSPRGKSSVEIRRASGVKESQNFSEGKEERWRAGCRL